MIFAAALVIAGPLVLAYLAVDCWRFVRRPRNRYVKRAPSRDCQRSADWRTHTPNTRY